MNQQENTRGVVSDADTESRNEEATEETSENHDSTCTSRNTNVNQQEPDPPEHRNPQHDGPSDASFSLSFSHSYSHSHSYMQQANAQNNDVAAYPVIPPSMSIPVPVHLPPQFHPPPGPQVLQFYEAQMRDHAAAYASAAAGAAWAAAQIAADIANASQATLQNPQIPRTLPIPPPAFPVPYPSYDVSMGGMAGMTGMAGYAMMDCRPPYPPMMDPLSYTGVQPDDISFASDGYGHGHVYGHGHRRRKRQQRMPPSDASNRASNSNSTSNSATRIPRPPTYQQPDENRGRRRRFRPDGSSDNGSDSNHSQTHISNTKRRARIRKVIPSSNSSDGGNSGAHFNKKKKARQPNDDSLLGKTGVSALYEWCGKRRTTPTFTLLHEGTSKNGELDTPSDEEKRNRGDEFDMTVSIDGVEWGRGRARTKSAAKQEAARRALQALLPGVTFDEPSGILIHLPTALDDPLFTNALTTEEQPAAPCKVSESLEDLAPNLAKRLAIGQPDDDNNDERPPNHPEHQTKRAGKDHSKKRPSKWHGVYPCASTTTSDEEDENAYYVSRGASVCSALLHAMVQIDDRIPEPPTYTYELLTVSTATADGDYPDDREGNPSPPKRKAETEDSQYIQPSTPFQVHRGPFTCTATMRLRQISVEGEGETEYNALYNILQAVGVGGAKREAKHTASAKLLALLFPECEGMVQVKEAAESARERYAESKALKQQSKRDWVFMSKTHRWNQSGENPLNTMFAMGPSDKDPALPSVVEEHFLRALGVDENAGLVSLHKESSITARQVSRQKQLDERIASALQQLNEHDDEGRSLPDQLTVDDVVGRTILRRASTEDLHWIARLLDDGKTSLSPISIVGQPCPTNVDEEVTSELASAPLKMWSSSSVVLLLCRAIAPYDDPPLGCAVLTFGFSMEKGRLLRIVQIGSKPHLPRERFIECLQAFAVCMKCSLKTKPHCAESSVKAASTITIRQDEIQCILRSHLSVPRAAELTLRTARVLPKAPKTYILDSLDESLVVAASTLQSVQEESEGVEESGTESSPEKRVAKKEQDKPSKRSRVA